MTTLQAVKDKYGIRPTDEVTVCASCGRASCWQGEFYCDDYKSANIERRTVRELVRLGLEDSHYWRFASKADGRS